MMVEIDADELSELGRKAGERDRAMAVLHGLKSLRVPIDAAEAIYRATHLLTPLRDLDLARQYFEMKAGRLADAARALLEVRDQPHRWGDLQSTLGGYDRARADLDTVERNEVPGDTPLVAERRQLLLRLSRMWREAEGDEALRARLDHAWSRGVQSVERRKNPSGGWHAMKIRAGALALAIRATDAA